MFAPVSGVRFSGASGKGRSLRLLEVLLRFLLVYFGGGREGGRVVVFFGGGGGGGVLLLCGVLV